MDALVATTARTIIFVHNGQPKQYPAGTEVNVHIVPGYLRIQVPGTLFEQDVTSDSLIMP